MKKKNENYFLGLDIGTDSVGWAVADENYKLIRLNNKNLWGVRLFRSASTAETRRANREARRRLERRKWRISLLQEIFAPAINAVDNNFFARLDDSNLYDGDKRENTIFSLFNDANFTDRDYHKAFKTIYHLRRALLTMENPDVRLAYLALHHIIKYRGHFLLDWNPAVSNDGAFDDISTPMVAINAYLNDRQVEGELAESCVEQFRMALLQRCGKNERAQNYISCFDVKGNKPICALLELIAGKTVKASKLPVSCEEDFSICFDGDWESVEDSVRTQLGEDYVLIENAKIIYNYAQIKALLGNHQYISEGMVEKYEKHRDDLARLKRVVKKYFPDQYRPMFRDAKMKTVTNYTAYSGKTNFGPKRNGKHVEMQVESDSRSYEEFAKYVRNMLSSSEVALKDAEVQQILKDIENETFMPKQVSKANATLPYQLNWIELNAILNNLCKYPQFDFLKQQEDGVSTCQKILSLLEFRMPYYVGPTNNHSGKYWCVRTQEGKILPWNYKQKIDLQKSEENFIDRMTGDCPYVEGEKVLPRCSLLYEEYVFLNQIGSIKIDGEILTPEQKQSLSNYYAQTGKNRLTKKYLREWMLSENLIAEDGKVEFSGFDDGATAHRRMYCNFLKILGSTENVEKSRKEIEEVIRYATVAGKEKQNLRAKLKKDYSCFTEEQAKRIVGLTCTGWGTCSSKFLTWRLGTNPYTGEIASFSIMDALRTTQGNFMEVYHSKVMGFATAFEAKRTHVSGEISYKVVNALYCSPAVKKQIWQSLEIVKELVRVLGCAPKKIFVEVARGIDLQKERRDENNRSKSRQKQIFDALNALKKNNAEYDSQVSDMFSQVSPQKLNNKKLYLYYLQNGRDIYTGQPIDYNHLEAYDIDHIVPRSKIKDDSLLNNLVLTEHRINVTKSDTYPIDINVRKNMTEFWRVLKHCGFMTGEKYNRLVRNSDLTEDELAKFINRQLVETQQSTVETIGLLRNVFPESEIVWSKAGNVSDFRKGENGSANSSLKFVKCREINDLHHAKDAYLNIVVGNVYNARYQHDARVYLRQNLEKAVPMSKLFMHDVNEGGKKAWVAGANGTIVQVQKTMQSNAILFTHESLVEKGQLFDATIYPKQEALTPLKGASSSNRKYALMSDTTKYGGFDKEKRVYYMLVKYAEIKKTSTKTKYKLLGVAAKDASGLTTDSKRIEYCVKAGLENPKILIPRIKVLTMFEVDGTMLMLSSKTGNNLVYRLAQQFSADTSTVEYVKKIGNVVEKSNYAKRHGEEFEVNSEYHGINKELNMVTYNVIIKAICSEKYRGASVLGSIGKKLNSTALRQKFSALSLLQQCVVLGEMLKLLQCNAQLSNLSELGESKIMGRIVSSSSLSSLDSIKIVHRSVTGIFEQKIPLSDFDKD